MRANDKVAVACVGLAWLGAVLLATSSEGTTDTPPDYRDIAAQLVQRGQASVNGHISFRQYKFIATAADFDELAALLFDSQAVAMPDIRTAAEAWVTDLMPAEREAWLGTVGYLNDTWRSQRIRMPDTDTALATIATQATASNLTPAPIARNVITHVTGNISTAIKDSRSVIKTERGGHRHPAVPMDISLASWQEAIDLGANIEGQEILASVNGANHSILYINHKADGSFGAGEYVFRDDLDWAPSEFRSFDDIGTDAQIVYGYDRSEVTPIARPAVVLQGELVDSGLIDVVVWVIDSWSESCTPAQVAVRLPPVHLEVNFVVSPTDPLVFVQEPEYLANVESCYKPVVAVTNVVMSIGSEEETADFDCDGYVTLDDVDSAIQVLVGVGEQP